MRIAIPLAEGKLSLHFGHCEEFALVQVDKESGTIESTEMLTPPPHEPGVLPRWLHEQNADLILAGGMGMRAQQLFLAQGIQVIVGAPAATPEALVRALLNGDLETGPNACAH